MICNCIKDYLADKERFSTEIMSAYSESQMESQGISGRFVPMRWVRPAATFEISCDRLCLEAQLLLENLSHPEKRKAPGN